MTEQNSAVNELVQAITLVCDRLRYDYDDVEKGIKTYLDAMLAIRLSELSTERQQEILSLVETMVREEDAQTHADGRHDFEEISEAFLQTALLLKDMPTERRIAVISVADMIRESQTGASVVT